MQQDKDTEEEGYKRNEREYGSKYSEDEKKMS